MPLLELSFACQEESLSIRRFSVHESMSSLFNVSVWARSPSEDIDLDAIVGQPAQFRLDSGVKHLGRAQRRWSGVCSAMELVQAEPTGLSTYFLRIVPKLWLLGQRVNHRVFQHLSIPDIVDRILAEWQIRPTWTIDRPQYPALELRLQYGESDFAFVSRLLEEAGIAYFFQDDGEESQLVLHDTPQSAEMRAGSPLRFVDNPNQAAEMEFVTNVRLAHAVRQGRHTIRDFDFRRPEYQLLGEARKALPPEDLLEHYDYQQGAFLVEGNRAGDTPVADDRGIARHLDKAGKVLAERTLDATRGNRRVVSFETNLVDVWPGVVFSMKHHRPDLQPDRRLLLVDFTVEGAPGEEWNMTGQALFADQPYRPQKKTPKPNVSAMQSAIVVGPKGEEIHTDEFGRVRVQFHWDREGKMDDNSSCWMRVSQGWAGGTYGIQMIPRIGHEVLVGFLDGNPDQPIVVGRVYNNATRVPYKLPKRKTRSTWKSDSSPGSNGFNELMFEDLKGQELVYVQAERDLKKLVKVDEAITVGQNRQKLVKNDEFERTNRDRHVTVDRSLYKLVKVDEVERTQGNHLATYEQDQDLVVKHDKRELVEQDSHLHVRRHLSEKVDGVRSFVVGDEMEIKVGNNHAIDAGQEIHVKAGMRIVLEAGARLTFKGPGGFIDIDDEGVVIQGLLVRINSGGSAGSGHGSHPNEAADAREAEPGDPELEDVFKREHE
jgi:type VI secretion system secreted protein VgrG